MLMGSSVAQYKSFHRALRSINCSFLSIYHARCPQEFSIFIYTQVYARMYDTQDLDR